MPDPTLGNYDHFVKIVKKISRQHFPRGCRQNYIPGLNKESSKTKAKYEELFKHNSFSKEMITEGKKLS